MPSLNDKTIKAFSPPESKHKIYWDDKVVGLGLRVTNKGAKSFVLRYVINGRERKYTIGTFPELSTSAARVMAVEIKSDVIRGVDPLEKRKTSNQMITIEELAKDFLDTKSKFLRKSTLEDYENFLLKKHILPKFGKRRIDSITKKELEVYHSSLSKTSRTANRMLNLLGAMFNCAIDWELIYKNPAKGIKKFDENKREKYLTEKEIHKMNEVLDAEENQLNSNIIRLIFLTGSRKGEVLSARWEDFDLDNGIWAKPASLTKQKKSSRIPLNQEAIDILKDMESKKILDDKIEDLERDAIVSNETYLFYNLKTKTHQKDIKRFWATVCKKAGLKGVRIHDLRHTFASVLVSSGVGLEVIGKLVGHSNIRTTQRYAHLADKALKEATEIFSKKTKKD